MAGREIRNAEGGCCAGTGTGTPRPIGNPPGQGSISYRVGDHARFKEALLSRLSSADRPALGSLGTREDDDFTVALCDALATALDVLTFYQERIANEHYLRTATEGRSVSAMARLIGYVPSPGVAASTHLAFTLQEAPGDPARADERVTIPAGTRVQSVPGPGEQAQAFETVEGAEARVAWNAVPAQGSRPWRPVFGDTDLFLAGVATQLQPGDPILIVGAEREADGGSERWDVRAVATVEPDPRNRWTRVTWTEGLGHVYPRKEAASEAVQVFALRQRAALFGHNAPDPNLLSTGDSNLANLIEPDPADRTRRRWRRYAIPADSIDLDAAYPKITAGSWVALVSNEEGLGSAALPGYVELYRAKTVRQVSRTDFGLSAKITRVEPDTRENLTAARFRIRETLALAQSEALPTVSRPLVHPVYGDRLALDRLVQGLAPGRPVAVSGKRQRIAVAPGVNHLKLATDEGQTIDLAEGDSVLLLGSPVQGTGAAIVGLGPEAFAERLGRRDVVLRLEVCDRDGRIGMLACKGSEVLLGGSRKDDPEVSEIAFLASGPDAVTEDRDRTTLRFSAPLTRCYERATVRVCANVARATHGESVQEILGSGDPSRPDQGFSLRQPPLTYVGAATPSGRQSTLALRVNDLLWSEVPSLAGRGGDERVYAVATDEGGIATVRFGDGVEGARLPGGQNNVRVAYRKGLGVAGNVAAGRVTNLLTRPLGVAGATNPEAAAGGEERESLAAARDNAPLTVLTLERAVSLRDYADFARAFAGIAKAHALWIPAGPARGIFLTVAGIDGAPLDPKGDTHRDLLAALRACGDPLVPVRLADHRPAGFRTRLAVKVAGEHEADPVLRAVEEVLRARFGFAARDFGEGVSVEEVMAVAHGVAGVEAVQVTRLWRPKPGVSPTLQPRLLAALPVASLTALPQAAELLTLGDGPLELEELP